MLLAIESSCDETAAAVVHDGVILSGVVSSQVRLHAEYGGVVPELAVREHLRNLVPVVDEALHRAGVRAVDIQAVGATRGPGLPAALSAGYAAAQGFAMSLGLPLYGVNHHEGHLYSPWIEEMDGTARVRWDQFEPNVSLIVSGGHTLLVHVSGLGRHRVLGGTLDDAAGECFDKVAKLVGLPYPGGPVLDRLAEEGNAAVHVFPRPLIHAADDDFSFSGLKTSVRTFLGRNPGLADDPVRLRDLCAGVRAAIVETLVTKTVRATQRLGLPCVTASGGVTCNRGLRRELAAACAAEGLVLRMSTPAYSTDNAAMIAVVAERRWKAGEPVDAPALEVGAGWSLESLGS